MPWIFGPGFDGHPKQVEMDDLRTLDVLQRAKAFKARTDEFLIRQADVFQSPEVWAPFPLAMMTCVGIEMIGAYKYGDAFADKNDHFKKLVEDMHIGFRDCKQTPDDEYKKLSYFVFKGFRHSLAHALYGKWVFITHDSREANTFVYLPKERLVVLNVYWFYKRFKEVYAEYFADLLAATDPCANPLKVFNETFEKNFDVWVNPRNRKP